MSIDLKRGFVSEEEKVKKARIVRKFYKIKPNVDDHLVITEAQLKQHFDKVYKSEGFDADELNDIEFMDIRALSKTKIAEWEKDLICYCTEATKIYNSDHSTSLVFAAIIKVVFLPWGNCSKKLFITFKAEDSSGSRPLQAKVYVPSCIDKEHPGDHFTVEFCREEPTSS